MIYPGSSKPKSSVAFATACAIAEIHSDSRLSSSLSGIVEHPLKRKDALEHADVSEKHALALMGHADGSAAHGLYGSRLTIKLLDSAIQKIFYRWIGRIC
jgi:hypothetical protein